jgi:hypothetical protein
LTSPGHGDLSSLTLKKWLAEFLLKLSNLLTQCRLGNKTSLGRSRKAAMFDNFVEVAKLPEVHNLLTTFMVR